jgi:hypothetical protein
VNSSNGRSGVGSRAETDAAGTGTPPDVDAAVDDVVLSEALSYARERDYTGWDYGDGMSSRVLQAVPVDNRLLNLAFQELIKRSPLNLRPLFLVERRRNFMGAALFAMANLAVADLASSTDRDVGRSGVDHVGEAVELLDWIVENRARGYGGFCVGHSHPIQDIQGKAERNEPGAVCTSYAVKALLRGASLGDQYARVAETAADFVVEDLDYRPTDHGARITYSNNHEGEYYTLNAGALAGRLFVDLYDHFGDAEYRRRGREILDHVVAKQEPCGGWLYRDPPSASHLSMDTHHNGFIIECLQRYDAATGSGRYAEATADALEFFRDELFDDDGAPHFDEDSRYPQDVHAAAQGILVFTYAGELRFARRILRWTVENLSDGAGRFYFRKGRFVTNRTTLMRWCQGWMAFAMAEYLRAACGEDPIASV